jgi:RNA polymerase sigma-70 factor (ECF subfamily)
MDDAKTRLATEALSHLDALYNLARWLTRDAVDAEDLVQETYLRAIRAAHQFQPGTNLRAWLFQILRNVFSTQYKRKGREPAVVDPEILEGLVGSGSGGGLSVERQAARSAERTAGLDLTAALNRLPEEYRSVVLLADLEEFHMEEIARVMDCPVGTVKSRLYRARAILRGLLQDYRR